MLSFNRYRDFLKMKRDPFDTYKITDSQEDKQKLAEFSNTLLEISKLCFRECSDFSQAHFSRKEEKCVEKCVDFHYECMLNILKFHNKPTNENFLVQAEIKPKGNPVR